MTTTTTKMYAQGDVLLVGLPHGRLTNEEFDRSVPVAPDPDGMVVLARGERSGHRHGFWENVCMFRDDSVARDVVVVTGAGAILLQDASNPVIPPDHGPVDLPPGAYEVRLQRRLKIEAPDDQRVARALD